MRRMLDPKEAGGSLPSTIKFDEEGNRTVGKNLGVDGKLTLKSLVSGTNPDGDITKELGGGGGGTPRHGYMIIVKDYYDNHGNDAPCKFHYEVYTTKNYNLTIGTENAVADFLTNENYKELRAVGNYPAAGFYKRFSNYDGIVWKFKVSNTSNNFVFTYRIGSPQEDVYDLNKPEFTIVQLY